ncbi:MAG: hypothetical protein H5T69_17530 [Chloroflexi bacterium]|nr:hypothetical protein [Chloroflexota bacterium]
MAAEFADQPVLFLEQYYYNDYGNRVSRFWAGYSGGQAAVPLTMVDSGQQVAVGGHADYDALYRGMIQTAMARLPQAEIALACRRVNDHVEAEVTVTNTSAITLSEANEAAVTLLAYEEARVLWTGRYVRGGGNKAIVEPLAPGEARTFHLATGTLDVDDWAKVHVVALADYRPSGHAGPYDMLQAAQRTCGVEDAYRAYVPLTLNAP